MLQVCVAPKNMDILAEYPRPVDVLMATSPEINAFSNNASPAGVANSDLGYYDAILYSGQAATTPSRGNETVATPYPDRLRPVRGLKQIINDPDILFERIDFYGYDPTLTGAPGQDAVTVAEIANSLTASPNDAYAQSRFTNAIVGNWNPNYFAPVVRFDDIVVCDHTVTDISDNHLGHLSIGPPLPYGIEYRWILKGGMKNIFIRAQLAQYIANSASANKFQRYWVLAVLRFRKRN